MTSVSCVRGPVVIRWFCHNVTLLTSVKFYVNLIFGELNNIYEFNTLGDFDRKRKPINNKLLRMGGGSSFTIFIC